jgi:predicted deacylase
MFSTPMQTRIHPLISPAPGTARSIASHHYGPADAPRKVYIQASLHADELPGMVVAWYLKRHFAQLEREGRLRAQIVLVPLANPAGLNQHWFGTQMGRFEMHSRQDFNRGFPALGPMLAARLADRLGADPQHNLRVIRAALREELARLPAATELASQRIALMSLACDADLVIDLHCDWEAVAHCYTTPDAWPLVEPLARYLGSEAQLIAEVSGGEPFDEACSQTWSFLRETFADRFPVPCATSAVTLELRGTREVSHEWAAHDAQAIVDYLIHAGLIDGRAAAMPPLRHPATPLASCEYISAPCSGVILHARQIGERVRAGDTIAEVLDPLEDRLVPLVARTDGLLYARHSTRFATAGMLVARIAGNGAPRQGALLVP